MKCNYTAGSTVIVTVFGKNKVGNVIDRTVFKTGIVYTIKTEDGKQYESVLVNGNDSVYINSSLTDVFINSIKSE